MFPMWLVLVPLPGTRPVYALLLAPYFDALYSPGDSVACPRIIRNVVLELRTTSLPKLRSSLDHTAEQDRPARARRRTRARGERRIRSSLVTVV